MLNAAIESVKQLESSIETKSTKLDAAMLRQQSLGTVIPKSCTFNQADFLKANVNVILALYRGDKPNNVSAPTVAIGGKENRMRAAVVRTYYNGDLARTMIETTIKGSICASEYEALEDLYKLSRAAVEQAIRLSGNEEGFKDWRDLGLS